MNRIKTVSSIAEMCAVPFSRAVNGVAYPNPLRGDFEGAAARICEATSLRCDPQWVMDVLADSSLAVQDAGARLSADLQALVVSGRRPKLRAQREENVFLTLFHHDFLEEPEMGRILCSYTVAATEVLENEDAELRPTGSHLSMYVARPGAEPFNLGLGTMTRHAGFEDPNGAEPYIHRAAPREKGAIRLLMLA